MHQLSKGASQNPFRKNRGRVVRVLFHPSKPFFFVATQQNVSGLGGRARAGQMGGARRGWAGWVSRKLRLQRVHYCACRCCCPPFHNRPLTAPCLPPPCPPCPPCPAPPRPVHAQVRVYNLAKQALARKLVAGSGVITSMAVHPSGDHLIVGSEDKRLWWAGWGAVQGSSVGHLGRLRPACWLAGPSQAGAA